MPVATYRVRSRLPVQYNTAIGRMVARLSVIEGRLRNIVYSLLELKSEFGRIAVRNPRVEDSFGMIQDLMALRGFTTQTPLKGTAGLITACKDLERFRDKVAHGIWVYHGKSTIPVLQVTAGSYSAEGQTHNARITPQALAVTLANFREYAILASEVLKGIDQLSRELKVQHVALLKKRQKQPKPGRSRTDPQKSQSPAKRKPRRKS